MPSDLLLPLFPLDVVLLPRMVLPLHIFEERYKLMVGEAIKNETEFGIVRSRENSVFNVGCTAMVEKVVQRHPDGRFDIIAVGQRRFEVLLLDEQKPYLQAGVHFFDDDPGTDAEPDAVRRLTGLFERVLEFLPTEAEALPASGKDLASFQIAGTLPVDLDVKQRLLVSRSEKERVEILTEYLEKLLPRLALTRRVERASRGNGSGR